jgi:hypothetical protein
MNTVLWSIGGIFVVFMLLFVVYKTAWFQRVRAHWLAFKLAWSVHKLQHAWEDIDSPKSKLKRARRVLAELREGARHPEDKVDDINEAIEAGWNYEDIGTTADEVIGYRNGESQKILARKILEQRRAEGEDCGLSYIISELAEEGGFTLSDIGTDEDELRSIKHRSMLQVYRSYVDDLRKLSRGEFAGGDSDPDYLHRSIFEVIADTDDGYNYTIEELGTSLDEMANLVKLAHIERAKKYFVQLQGCATEGDAYRKDYIIKKMREHLEKANATLSDIGSSGTEIENLARDCHVQRARNDLNHLRNPDHTWFIVFGKELPGNPEQYVITIRENLASANATLGDIGINEEEISELLNKGYVYAITTLLENLRNISKIPRVSKFEAGARLLSPNLMVMFGSVEERKEFDEPEEQYPYERDMAAIRYYIEKVNISLEQIGSSEDDLRQLALTFQAR